MKKILADTSGGRLSITLADDHLVLSNITLRKEKGVNEAFLGVFDYVLKSAKVDVSEIDQFYIVTGPGSFTGIRVGIGSMLGITSGLDKKLYGITSLDAAAISTGLDSCAVAVKLKGSEYAYSEYSFDKNSGAHSQDYKIVDKVSIGSNTIIINSGKESTDFNIDLSMSLVDDRFNNYITDWFPFYMRKSEAEIQFDKKSCN